MTNETLPKHNILLGDLPPGTLFKFASGQIAYRKDLFGVVNLTTGLETTFFKERGLIYRRVILVAN